MGPDRIGAHRSPYHIPVRSVTQFGDRLEFTVYVSMEQKFCPMPKLLMDRDLVMYFSTIDNVFVRIDLANQLGCVLNDEIMYPN